MPVRSDASPLLSDQRGKKQHLKSVCHIVHEYQRNNATEPQVVQSHDQTEDRRPASADRPLIGMDETEQACRDDYGEQLGRG